VEEEEQGGDNKTTEEHGKDQTRENLAKGEGILWKKSMNSQRC